MAGRQWKTPCSLQLFLFLMTFQRGIRKFEGFLGSYVVCDSIGTRVVGSKRHHDTGQIECLGPYMSAMSRYDQPFLQREIQHEV